MNSRFPWNWKALAGLVFLALAGTFFVCRATTGCFAAAGRNGDPRQVAAAEAAADTEQDFGGNHMFASFTPARVEHASEASFDRQVLESDTPVLVDFYADWCGPCQALAPTLEALAREVPHARVVKVNVDENPALAARYGINSIPSLMVFENGQSAAHHVGLASKEQLKALLAR
jgi:thioredoxin 1